MRSNGVSGVTSGRQAAMQARQQLRHSEYLEASVAELADNFQAMLWQQRRDPTAHLGQQQQQQQQQRQQHHQQQQQVVLMRHQQQQQQQLNNNNNRRHTQHFGDFDHKLYGGGAQQQQRLIQTRPQITKL